MQRDFGTPVPKQSREEVDGGAGGGDRHPSPSLRSGRRLGASARSFGAGCSICKRELVACCPTFLRLRHSCAEAIKRAL